MAAASLPADLQAELNALILSLEGLERARYLAIASIACFLYDFAVTFDQEVRSGPSVFYRLPRRHPTGGILLEWLLVSLSVLVLRSKCTFVRVHILIH